MPNSQHHVTLTVLASKKYAFTGGNKGHGNCKNVTGKGAAPVLITLKAPKGFRIRAMTSSPPGVQLLDIGAKQMKATVAGSGRSAVIKNPCKCEANVTYIVNVATPGGANIRCHPKIVNT